MTSSAAHIDETGDRLGRAALADVAALGFAGLTLRSIASRADCTTGAIVQRFVNRDGLIQAACILAMEREIVAHRDLAATISTLALTCSSVADLIAHYILSRARRDEARLFLWASVTGGEDGGACAPLARWHEVRSDFWRLVLMRAGLPVERAGALTSYVLMEELFATALAGDATHALLLAEAARSFLRSGDTLNPSTSSLAEAIDEQPRPTPAATSDAPVRERLLRAAADEILAHGVEALSQRRAARIAQASPSAITYHFGNMESFINEAVWSALARDMPRELDPAGRLEECPLTIEQWLSRLAVYLRPRDEAAAGFYTNFARIAGQMCLLVATRPALRPLAGHLRALEGWGTHRASQRLADRAFPIRRDHAAAFAIWIKGEAILRNAGAAGGAITSTMLIDGARTIFPRVAAAPA